MTRLETAVEPSLAIRMIRGGQLRGPESRSKALSMATWVCDANRTLAFVLRESSSRIRPTISSVLPVPGVALQ